MTHPAFDTLKFVQKLKVAGMPEQQAIAIAEAQNEALMESTNHMIATKADIYELKQELKQDISQVKGEIAELRIDLIGVKSTLKLHNWMISFVLTGITALILKAFFV